MTPAPEIKEPMTDAEATDLDNWMLDLLCSWVFDPKTSESVIQKPIP